MNLYMCAVLSYIVTMTKMKIYTVRSAGQFVGTYRATSGKYAIQRFLDEQNTLASTFRRSCPMPKFPDLTAEEKPEVNP